MSKTVDERVVSMQFDNKQFESGVQTSIGTLDKLKQSLKLEDAAKGLNGVSEAARKFDISPLSKGVEEVKLKFSALEVMAVTSLANITNQAVNAGKRLISAFTIDPIKTGFQEYELKMGSMQTIMASTGASIDEVNGYLNELNTYSDKTIYSFSDMTNNIGKFTNAGVKLEDAVKAIKGISNEAAVSGANANEASRAMYNFAQALSAGYVKLIDWKSIENANMATKEFKQQLIDSAVAAGTLTKTSDGMYKTSKRNITATQNFNDSLQDQWMTTEVLVNTLNKYSDETTDIGKKAFAAAQDVKTFSMMMDTLKEAAQSGWAQTHEILFGNLEQAKKLWTGLADTFGNIISKSANARNEVLEGALSSKWSQFKKVINEAGISTSDLKDKVRETYEGGESAFDKMMKNYKTLGQAVKDGAVSTSDLKKALTDLSNPVSKLAGIKEKLQNGSSGDDVKNIQKALKDLKFDLGEFGENMDGIDGKFGPFTTKAVKAFQAAHKLEQTGIVDKKTLKALDEATKKTSKFKGDIDEILDGIEKKGGRALIIESFKNAFEALEKILKSVSKAWNNVFPAMTSKKLYNIIEKVNEFSKTLTISKDKAGKLQDTFEGLFSALRVVGEVFGTIIKLGSKLAWNLFKPLASILLDVTSTIGKFVKKGADVSSAFIKPVSSGLETVIGLIGKFTMYIADNFSAITNTITSTVDKWKKKFEETKAFKLCSKYFKQASDEIKEILGKLKSYVDGFKFDSLNGKFKDFGDAFGNVIKKVGNSKLVTSAIKIFAGAISTLWDSIKNFQLPKIDFSGLSKLFGFFSANTFSNAKDGIKGFFSFIGGNMSTKFQNFKDNVLVKVSDFYLKHGDAIKKGVDKIRDVIKSLTMFIVGSDTLTLPGILSVTEKFLAVLALIKVLGIVDSVLDSISSIGDGISNLTKAVKYRAVGSAFKSMAVALGAFAVVMVVISKMKPEDAYRSAGLLMGFIVVLGGVITAISLLASKTLTGKVDLVAAVGSMLMLAGSLALLVLTLDKLNGMNLNQTKRSLGILTGVLLVLSASVRIIGASCSGASFKSAAAIITLLTAVKMVLGVLKDYAAFDWDSVQQAIPKVIEALIGLALILRLATSGIKAGANTGGLALLMISIVASVKILLDVIKEMADMDPDKMWQGIKGITAVMGGITLMLIAINLTNKGGILEKGQRTANSFVGLATALIAVAGVIWILGSMDTQTLVKGGSAVIAILGMFTLMMTAVGKATSSGFKTRNLIVMLIGFGLILAEMAIIVKIMSSVRWADAIGSAVALSTLIGAMSGCLILLSKNSYVKAASIYKWIGAMATFGLVIAELAGILIVLKATGVSGSEALGQVVAISVLLGTMTGVLYACTIIGPVADAAIPALKVLAIALGALAGIILLFGGIASIGPVMSWLETGVKVFELMGDAIGKFLGGIVGGLVSGVSSTLPQLGKDLSSFMTNASVFFDGLNNIDGSAVIKAGALTAIITALTGESMLNGIANFFTVGHSLPNLGSDLGTFMTNAEPFFNKLTNIPGNAIDGAKALSDVVLALSAAGFIDGISKLLGMGESGMSAVGDQLVPFGDSLVKYADSVSSLTDEDAEKIKMSANAGKALAELSSVVPRTGGFWQDIIGEKDMAKFGSGMEAFGKCLVAYSNSVSELTEEDATNIANSAESGKSLASLNNAVPRTGGWAQDILGEKDMAKFGSGMISFAKCLVQYAKEVTELTEEDAAHIKSSSEAGMSLADLNDAIPKTGGWAQDILGEKDMAKFSKGIVAFAKGLVSYAKEVAGLSDSDVESINRSKSAMEAMKSVVAIVPTTGGLWQKITGEKDAGKFGSGMSALAKGVKDYCIASSGITEENVASIENSKSAVSAMAEVAGEVSRSGGIFDSVFGGRDLSGFSVGMSQLGSAIMSCISKAKFIDDDGIEAIGRMKSAIKMMCSAAKAIPNEGGLVSLITGDNNNYGTFGSGMVKLAGQIITCINKAKGITDDDIACIERLKDAIKKMASAAKAVPNEGGLISLIVGDNNNVGTFGAGMVKLAGQILTCISKAKSISDDDITAIDNLKSAIKSVVSAANEIPLSFADSSGAMATATSTISKLVGIVEKMATIDTSGVDTFKQALKDLGNTGIDGFVDTFSNSTEKVSGAMSSFIANANKAIKGGASSLKSSCSAVGKSAVDSLSNSFKGSSSKMASAASTMISTFASSVRSKVGTVKSSFSNVVSSALSGITSKASQFNAAGTTVMSSLANGIRSKEDSVKIAVLVVLDTCKTAIKGNYDNFSDAGKYLGEGLTEGIAAKEQDAYDAGYKLGQKAVQGEKDGQESNSPSKATIKAGKWLGEGLIIGMNKMGSTVYDTGNRMGKTATSSLSKAISKVGDMFETGIDAQPTIRPVLDLSDIQSGIGTMDGLFNSSHSVGLMANVGAINTMMNNRQNGDPNADVVSAISKLRKDISNMPANVTNINGITYDDGSNINSAIQQLVRVARVERRA